jgi:hypothetical protein
MAGLDVNCDPVDIVGGDDWFGFLVSDTDIWRVESCE